MLSPVFTVVYIRPHPSMLADQSLAARGFEADHNSVADAFQDFSEIAAANLEVRPVWKSVYLVNIAITLDSTSQHAGFRVVKVLAHQSLAARGFEADRDTVADAFPDISDIAAAKLGVRHAAKQT